jgi:hypothetical protein
MIGPWLPALLQQPRDVPAMPALSGTMIAISLALIIIVLAAMWKVFEKAGQPGWTAIIPFVNYFFLSMAAGKPAWWGILFFVPIVNIVIWFIVAIDLAKRFGKGTGFGIGLALLPIIFFPILAFDDAQARPVPA